MLSRFTRLAFTGCAIAGIGLAAGIPGCTCATTPGTPDEASLIAKFAAGNTVQSDGSSRLKVTLVALNKNHKGDTNPITVTAPATNGGFLAPAGGDFVAGNTLTGSPDAQGSFNLEYTCVANFAGKVTLAATNSDATTDFQVACTKPEGEIVITVHDDTCSLEADGSSQCDIGVDVVEDANGVNIPVTGQLAATVTTAVPLDPTVTIGDLKIIADSGSKSETTNVNLDATGHGTITIIAPLIPEIATISYTVGGTSVTKDLTINIFKDLSDVKIAAQQSIVGGTGANDLSVTISAFNGDGTVAANKTLDSVEISSSTAQTYAISATSGQPDSNNPLLIAGITLDANGEAVVTITTPTVTAEDILTVTTGFTSGNLPQQTASKTVAVEPEGTLLLNLTPSPTSLKSDDPTKRQTTLTVSFTKNAATVPSGTVDIQIPADSVSRIRFDSGDPVQQTLPSTAFDSSGNATIKVDVVDIPGGLVPTSVATVNAIGHDGTPADDVAAHVNIDISRDPLLQNIVFVGVTPTGPIGVLGGSLPATAIVAFQLVDDSGHPLPNIEVSFAKNVTADPSISVLPNSISDGSGNVTTVLSAGTIPGPVSVVATATVTDANGNPILSNGQPIVRSSQSSAIIIVGALPSFETSNMSCGTRAQHVPWNINCSAQIVDRFTNNVDGVPVQFSAEASNENATVTTSDGSATVAINSDSSFSPDADVVGWSYGEVLPTNAADLASTTVGGFTAQDAADCFDDTISTPCNLLKLCEDPELAALCPLPPGCAAEAQIAEDVIENPVSALQFGTNNPAGSHQKVIDYITNHRACGFPVGCLTGHPAGLGLSVTDGDQCTVALGCFDFSGTTECPQNHLRTIMASTRGAEAFSDANGNGIFDFVDTNGNGKMDEGESSEAFVDLPEPFLDVNDNCVRDDLTTAGRFETQPIFALKNTDIFSDVSGDGVFGFTTNAGITRTNKVWDADTQIFLTTHMLEIGDPTIEVGETCANPGTQHACADGSHSTCRETARGNIARCNPPNLLDGAVVDIQFRWADAEGNCPSIDFKDQANLTASGPVLVAGDVQFTLNTSACGFGERQNPLFPECTSMAGLGAPILNAVVSTNCADADSGSKPASLTFTLGGVTDVKTFTVTCVPAP